MVNLFSRDALTAAGQKNVRFPILTHAKYLLNFHSRKVRLAGRLLGLGQISAIVSSTPRSEVLTLQVDSFCGGVGVLICVICLTSRLSDVWTCWELSKHQVLCWMGTSSSKTAIPLLGHHQKRRLKVSVSSKIRNPTIFIIKKDDGSHGKDQKGTQDSA